MSENGKEKGDLPRDSVFRFLFSEKNMGLTFILILHLFSTSLFHVENIPAIQRKMIHLENSHKENLHMEYIPTYQKMEKPSFIAKKLQEIILEIKL